MFKRKIALILFPLTLAIVSLGCAVSFSFTPLPTVTTPVIIPATVTSLPPTSVQTETILPTIPSPTSNIVPTTAVLTSTPVLQVTPGSPSGPYAVILVQPGDVLNIRSAAGVNHPVVGSFTPTSRDVMRTGPSTWVGNALWVEVQKPGGGAGWVNSNFLTEYVSASAFCADPQVTSLLNDLRMAVLNSNGNALSALPSPAHGLNVRFWRYGTLVNYNSEQAKFLFDSTFQVNWGPAPGSGEDTIGSFSQVVLPKLIDVFGSNYQLYCNDTLDLATFSLEPWPPEYVNVNFYAVYKPGSEIYGGLDWRAWLVGVEVFGGKPYLFSLIHFQWEP